MERGKQRSDNEAKQDNGNVSRQDASNAFADVGFKVVVAQIAVYNQKPCYREECLDARLSTNHPELFRIGERTKMHQYQ